MTLNIEEVGLESLIIDDYKAKLTENEPPKKSTNERPFFYQIHQIHTLSTFEFVHSKLAKKYNVQKFNLNVCNWVKPQFIIKKVDALTASTFIGKHRKTCTPETIDIKKYSDCAASGRVYQSERPLTIGVTAKLPPKVWEKKLPSQRNLARSCEMPDGLSTSRLNSASKLSETSDVVIIQEESKKDQGL